ncbi:hypothetical protein CHARACLAT_033192, partial [Characodon lateralis]|nr:hypothetical protein [Characodon lateralis]
ENFTGRPLTLTLLLTSHRLFYLAPQRTILSQRSVVRFHKFIKTNLNSERRHHTYTGTWKRLCVVSFGGAPQYLYIPLAAMQYTYTIILSVDVSPQQYNSSLCPNKECFWLFSSSLSSPIFFTPIR